MATHDIHEQARSLDIAPAFPGGQPHDSDLGSEATQPWKDISFLVASDLLSDYRRRRTILGLLGRHAD